MTPEEERLRVAVQGEPGCFSHAAAQQHFGEVTVVPCRGFHDLFDAVLGGSADRGCVPVENALAGAVGEALDLLARHPLQAVAETYLRVEMCLAVRPGTTAAEVHRVASHPVALRQCRGFFARHPEVEEVVAADTAGSIRDLMSSGQTSWNGAIGPALAAELYGAQLLVRGIQDHPRNFTRFLMVARDGDVPPAQGPGVKASLVFTLPHRPGSLHRAIGAFAARSLDLTRLESRPIPGRPWEYRFFVDVRGAAGEAWSRALADLRTMTDEVRELGRYPEAPLP